MKNNEVEFRQLKVPIDKMTNPVFQNISRNNDLAEVTRFFLIFSWFEYALKRASYLKKKKNAEADWDSFSDCINGDLKLQLKKSEELRKAVKYLEKSPPAKQITKEEENGARYLDSDRSTPQGNKARVLTTYIKMIRNNLFHGGKIPFEPNRDTKLIRSAITILTHFLELDSAQRVKHCYESGGTWGNN